MATALVSVETREVVRCEHCTLVQYRTSNSMCRRCHKPLDIEEPIVLGPQPVPAPSAHSSGDAGMHVAGQVREIRKARHLSQRQLASRMQVPRTYISKIENGKAIPTLGSLERLACALEVEVSRLVRDARSVAKKRSPPFWQTRSWPRSPRCCRGWIRCSARCSTGPCATRPTVSAGRPSPPRRERLTRQRFCGDCQLLLQLAQRDGQGMVGLIQSQAARLQVAGCCWRLPQPASSIGPCSTPFAASSSSVARRSSHSR